MSDLPPPPPSGPGTPCPRCGANVAPGQDWCLNCGAAATTRVAGASGMRTPLIVAGVVLALAAAGLIIAFLSLSGDDNTVVADGPSGTPTGLTPTPGAPTGATGPTGPTGAASGASGASGPTGPEDEGPTGTKPTPTAGSSPTPSGGAFAAWPTGTTAYTVIVYSGNTRAQAEAKAKSVSGLPGLGILHSNDYPSLRKGYWVVFSGQYDTIKQATAAAKSAQGSAPGAYPKQVKPK